MNSLFTDLDDGHVLLELEDKLQPGIVNWKKVNPKPVKSIFKKNENSNYAVSIAKGMKMSLVGIAGSDISQGHKQYILAIIWQLRRAYLLDYLSKLSKKGGKEYTEQNLLEEANAKVKASGRSSQITGFSDPELKTSRFLFDLIASFEPRAVDEEVYLNGTQPDDLKQNARYAIAAARKIGASIFCIWEDIVNVNPKMLLTFIGSVVAEGHEVTNE